MMRSSFAFHIFLMSALALPLAAHADKQEVVGAGSTFAAAAYTSWGFSYAKERNTTVVYRAVGSGEGIRQMIARGVDFGASDFALSPEELNKHGLLQFPTLVGGVVPVINLPGIKAGQLKLTGTILASIFGGRISHWNDRDIQALNPGMKLPDLAIRRIVRLDDSGTTAAFTDYLSKADAAWANSISTGLRVSWPKGTEGVKGNEAMANAVQSVAGAIGYLSAYETHRSKLAYVLLQNKNRKFVAPTDEALYAAVKAAPREERLSFIDTDGPNAWPITDATYILIEKQPKNPDRARETLRFFYWAFLRGDVMAAETGYVPLPSPVQARVVGTFREVRDARGNPLDFMNALTNRYSAIASAGTRSLHEAVTTE